MLLAYWLANLNGMYLLDPTAWCGNMYGDGGGEDCPPSYSRTCNGMCALLRAKKVFAGMVFGVCDSKLNYQGSIFD